MPKILGSPEYLKSPLQYQEHRVLKSIPGVSISQILVLVLILILILILVLNPILSIIDTFPHVNYSFLLERPTFVRASQLRQAG